MMAASIAVEIKGLFFHSVCSDVLTWLKLSVFGVRVDPLSRRGTNNRSQFLLKTRICQLSVFYPFSGISFLAICSHCYLDSEQSALSPTTNHRPIIEIEL